MPQAAFGNDPAKAEGYKAFWARDSVKRPLVAFSMVGWFPLQEFKACQAWGDAPYVTLDMINPADFLADHERMLKEGEKVDDDAIRGAYPGMVAIPWLPPILGCDLRLLPSNVMGDERNLSWEEAMTVKFDPANPWYKKYLEFAKSLVKLSDGRFPVGHGAEIGPTDLHAVLRGHTQSIMDLMKEPQKSHELMMNMGEAFTQLAKTYWAQMPLFAGGYFDAQYYLWSPGSIVRMQEDATAVYSPRLYEELVLPVDRMIAQSFECAFIHLHPPSLFLLDLFLQVEEIRCFEVNREDAGPPLKDMIPNLRKIQDAGRSLLVRGFFTPDELDLISDKLSANGLFLQILVEGLDKVEELRPHIGM